MSYTLAVTVAGPFAATVTAVRAALSEQGFGVLTEIDVADTLKRKLDVDLPAQLILGACRPELAHRALQAAPAIAALLPCNVVIRDVGGATAVEAIDPTVMVALEPNPVLQEVAADARQRLVAALAACSASPAL